MHSTSCASQPALCTTSIVMCYLCFAHFNTILSIRISTVLFSPSFLVIVISSVSNCDMSSPLCELSFASILSVPRFTSSGFIFFPRPSKTCCQYCRSSLLQPVHCARISKCALNGSSTQLCCNRFCFASQRCGKYKRQNHTQTNMSQTELRAKHETGQISILHAI